MPSALWEWISCPKHQRAMNEAVIVWNKYTLSFYCAYCGSVWKPSSKMHGACCFCLEHCTLGNLTPDYDSLQKKKWEPISTGPIWFWPLSGSANELPTSWKGWDRTAPPEQAPSPILSVSCHFLSTLRWNWNHQGELVRSVMTRGWGSNDTSLAEPRHRFSSSPTPPSEFKSWKVASYQGSLVQNWNLQVLPLKVKCHPANQQRLNPGSETLTGALWGGRATDWAEKGVSISIL